MEHVDIASLEQFKAKIKEAVLSQFVKKMKPIILKVNVLHAQITQHLMRSLE